MYVRYQVQVEIQITKYSLFEQFSPTVFYLLQFRVICQSVLFVTESL